ncbi:putative membrane protein (plasmid) [Staphylococcus epidermidis]|nr:putative membrane protein [Staphylococcus epidermidis]
MTYIKNIRNIKTLLIVKIFYEYLLIIILIIYLVI